MKNQDTQKNRLNNKVSVFVALFAALVAAGGFIAIPTPSGVPIVLQNMLAITTGILLGGIQGGGAVGLFLLAGSFGLPVFAGGKGGMSHLIGPTGGFLFGYFIAALIVGLYIGKPNFDKPTPLAKIISASLIGYLIVYIAGIVQFMAVTEYSFLATISACVIPFLPGLIVKLIITVFLGWKLRPLVARYVFSEN
ncbi:MAG: biotin transporter BioY [Treponema sp. CETP13]|nr:MAG: biotin transporter BioY [Treponema sp. CETP13]